MVVVVLVTAALVALWTRDNPGEESELRPVTLSQEIRDELMQARTQELTNARQAKKATRVSRRKAAGDGNEPAEAGPKG